MPLSILIVDDDDLDRLAVRRCLQESVIRAVTDEAGGAEATLERVRSTRYDCILLDYYLPDMDGLGLLEAILASAPDTPVIIFTGRGDEDIAVELMKSGAADYLPKASLSPERLTTGIRHALTVAGSELARRRVEQLLRLLGDIAEHLLTADDPERLIGGLFERIREPLNVDVYGSGLIDDEGAMRLVSWHGVSEEAARALLDAAVSLTDAVSDNQPLHIPRVRESHDAAAAPFQAAGLQGACCLTLVRQQAPLGYLYFGSREKPEFPADELDFLRTVGHYVTAACERLRHIERLRQADRQKNEVLAILSHELRDPLAPLRNMLEVVKRAGGQRETVDVACAVMERQLGQLEQLVQDLFDASRITHGQLTLRRQHGDLVEIIERAVERCMPRVLRGGHDLRINVPGGAIGVDADPIRLTQVFSNLLTNACKYTEKQGVIELTLVVEDGQAVVTVRDTGIGIPPEKLESVFDMFSQVGSAIERAEGGLGIGLTLVKRLVESHGGLVEAHSDGDGLGSEFVVRLPVLGEPPTAESSKAMDEPAAMAPRRVLVVDDNRDSASSLAMLLKAMGHTTEEAYDGLAAIALAERFEPDVILLDIDLPGMSGYDVCGRIRAQPGGDDITIAALTGWDLDDDPAQSRSAKFDRHIIKPVNYIALAKLLSEPFRSRATPND